MPAVVVRLRPEVHEVLPADETQVGEVRVQHVNPGVHEADGHASPGESHRVEIPSSGHREGPLRSGNVRAEECTRVHDMSPGQDRERGEDNRPYE